MRPIAGSDLSTSIIKRNPIAAVFNNTVLLHPADDQITIFLQLIGSNDNSTRIQVLLYVCPPTPRSVLAVGLKCLYNVYDRQCLSDQICSSPSAPELS